MKPELASLRRPTQLVSCTAIVLSSLLLAGCTSAGYLANIYLVSFAPRESPTITVSKLLGPERAASPSLSEMRVGYFSLCARMNDDDSWFCGNRLEMSFLGGFNPSKVYKVASDYRSNIVSPTLK